VLGLCFWYLRVSCENLANTVLVCGTFWFTTKRTKDTKTSDIFDSKLCVLSTTILQNLRETRKFVAPRNYRIRILLSPRRQERQVRKSNFFLCGPFDRAQGMLCAFPSTWLRAVSLSNRARDIPRLGCGFAALGSSWCVFLLRSLGGNVNLVSSTYQVVPLGYTTLHHRFALSRPRTLQSGLVYLPVL